MVSRSTSSIAGEVGAETRFDKMIVGLPGGGEMTQVSFDANGTPFPDRIQSATDLYERFFGYRSRGAETTARRDRIEPQHPRRAARRGETFRGSAQRRLQHLLGYPLANIESILPDDDKARRDITYYDLHRSRLTARENAGGLRSLLKAIVADESFLVR